MCEVGRVDGVVLRKVYVEFNPENVRCDVYFNSPDVVSTGLHRWKNYPSGATLTEIAEDTKNVLDWKR